MRTLYDAAVLELGHILEDEHFEAMQLCDVIAVVVRLDVPGLRQARQLLSLLADKGLAAERIRLIANRYGQRGQLSLEESREGRRQSIRCLHSG